MLVHALSEAVLTSIHNLCLRVKIKDKYTAAFTYYNDPAILRNKLTPLSIFRDFALKKRDSKNNCLFLCVL